MPKHPGMNVLALQKYNPNGADGDRYIFLYDDTSTPELLRTFGQFAVDKELSFTWYDAAVLSQKVRRRKATREAREKKDLEGNP